MSNVYSRFLITEPAALSNATLVRLLHFETPVLCCVRPREVLLGFVVLFWPTSSDTTGPIIIVMWRLITYIAFRPSVFVSV